MSSQGADRAGVVLSYFIGLSTLVSAIALLAYVVRWW